MPGIQPKATILIRYPRIRGYVLSTHALKGLITNRFEADISLEEHAEDCLALILNGKHIYAEPADEKGRINVPACIEAIRNNRVIEHARSASGPQPEQETDNDPDHRQWLNSVCSGE